MKILAVDIGGTHVKFKLQGDKEHQAFDSGRLMTPLAMMSALAEQTKDWKYDRVSLGYPGPVRKDRPALEPHNLGPGWTVFNFEKAFKKPVRMINDAAMQALGAYKGGSMLFLGLGTGLGSALIVDDVVKSLELAHLGWKKGKTYEQHLGADALHTLGKKAWRKQVALAIEALHAAFVVDYIVLGGGNAKRVKDVPDYVQIGSNADAFTGAFRLWSKK